MPGAVAALCPSQLHARIVALPPPAAAGPGPELADATAAAVALGVRLSGVIGQLWAVKLQVGTRHALLPALDGRVTRRCSSAGAQPAGALPSPTRPFPRHRCRLQVGQPLALSVRLTNEGEADEAIRLSIAATDLAAGAGGGLGDGGAARPSQDAGGAGGGARSALSHRHRDERPAQPQRRPSWGGGRAASPPPVWQAGPRPLRPLWGTPRARRWWSTWRPAPRSARRTGSTHGSGLSRCARPGGPARLVGDACGVGNGGLGPFPLPSPPGELHASNRLPRGVVLAGRCSGGGPLPPGSPPHAQQSPALPGARPRAAPRRAHPPPSPQERTDELLNACVWGDLEGVEGLLGRGCPVDTHDYDGGGGPWVFGPGWGWGEGCRTGSPCGAGGGAAGGARLSGVGWRPGGRGARTPEL